MVTNPWKKVKQNTYYIIFIHDIRVPNYQIPYWWGHCPWWAACFQGPGTTPRALRTLLWTVIHKHPTSRLRCPHWHVLDILYSALGKWPDTDLSRLTFSCPARQGSKRFFHLTISYRLEAGLERSRTQFSTYVCVPKRPSFHKTYTLLGVGPTALFPIDLSVKMSARHTFTCVP